MFYYHYNTVGVFMRDITLCNEGTPKKLKNGLYNFSKLRNLVMMVSYVHVHVCILCSIKQIYSIYYTTTNMHVHVHVLLSVVSRQKMY